MKDKIMNFIKNHPFRTVGTTFFLLIILPPLLINVIYKVPAFWWVIKNEIPAGNLLSYWGTVLTFCATFSLSIAIFFQNKENTISNKLVTNEAFIDISEDSTAEITTYDFTEGISKMLLKLNVKVLSRATISLISINSLSCGYEGFDDKRENFEIIRSSHKELLLFERREKYTECYTPFIEITNELKSFMEEKDKITIRMKIEINCNDVITPVNITLNLKKQSSKISFTYSYDSVRIHHGKPEILKN